jgi:diaminohydroxyphosphoribosylaminopyrimidine deaminase/5-amino-6-(5-phosphoribosylamino)uracil reductase
MERALMLAARGLFTTDPNPRVGCVLVRDGVIVGEGWHERAGEAHAEVAALRAAGARACGATAYVTLEPCSHTGRTPPCVDALIAARVERVVCSSIDPNPRVSGEGLKKLEAAGIQVSVGELASEARALNLGFFSRFERARPWIRLKLAMSLDARTAPAAGGREWITGDAARADVQHFRARSSAVLTGAGTVRVDDPELNVRLDYGPWIRQPLRVVLDPSLSCSPRARIFAGGRALILTSKEALARSPEARPTADGVDVEGVPSRGPGLDLATVIERLTAREVNELLVECGPRLAASFVAARLLDELILYVAPHLMGADAAPLFAISKLKSDAPLPAFEFARLDRMGDDIRAILTPKGP